jgi:vacuolar-type H+-ATPase subunit I/STV1
VKIIANDGSEFESVAKCLHHEKTLRYVEETKEAKKTMEEQAQKRKQNQTLLVAIKQKVAEINSLTKQVRQNTGEIVSFHMSGNDLKVENHYINGTDLARLWWDLFRSDELPPV